LFPTEIWTRHKQEINREMSRQCKSKIIDTSVTSERERAEMEVDRELSFH
jgi:hypothetical protein